MHGLTPLLLENFDQNEMHGLTSLLLENFNQNEMHGLTNPFTFRKF